jgi:hypothetical protein
VKLSEVSIASRISSWRKPNALPSTTSTPRASASSTALALSGTTDSSSA